MFTRVVAPVSSIIHRFGFRILRYLDDWLVLGVLLPRDSTGEQLPPLVVSGAQHSSQPGQELSDSFTDPGLSGDEASDASFEGFPDPQTCPEAVISRLRFRLLSSSTSVSLASAVRGDVISVGNCSGVSPPDAVFSAPPQFCWSSPSGLRHRVLGRFLPRGSSVVV